MCIAIIIYKLDNLKHKREYSVSILHRKKQKVIYALRAKFYVLTHAIVQDLTIVASEFSTWGVNRTYQYRNE